MSLNSKVLNFHKWLTVSPKELSGEERSSLAILSYSTFCGGLAHLVFIPLFYFTGIEILSIINIASVIIFYFANFILRKYGNQGIVIFLSISEVVGHSYIATYFIGWNSSFHYYILLIIGVLPLAVFTWKSRIIGVIFILFSYLLLYLLSNTIWISENNPSTFVHLYSIINLNTFIIVMGTASSYLGWLTQQSRNNLVSIATYNTYLYLDSNSARKELEESYKNIQLAYNELRKTQEQLLEAEKLASLGQLVGGISHELNNPISVIQTNSELLRMILRKILLEIPVFLNSLNDKDRKLFYEIVENSLKNKEYLNSREERKRKREYQLEINSFTTNEELSSSLADKFISLRLPPPHSTYLNILSPERLNEFLDKAQIFKNQSMFLENIDLAIDKASRVIFSLRSYLNVETYNQRKKVDLIQEVERAIRVYDNYVIGKIEIIREYTSEIFYTGIVESLFQVWKNLIFNAIQATENEKKILINIQKYEKIPDNLKSYISSQPDIPPDENIVRNWIILKFRDYGSGLHPEIQKKIFTPFFTTRSLGEGIGLGLYTCKKIVHEHGGALFFKSGEGSTEFVVVLVDSG